MKRLISNIRSIITGYDGAHACRLLSTYIRILIGNRIHASSRPGTARVLGYAVAFPSRATFFSQFVEIFIEQPYAHRGPLHTIIDCGSNIGMSMLYFVWLHPEADITCFEPNEESLRYLRMNVAENGLARVKIVPSAVGGNDGMVTFYHEAEVLASTGATMHPGRAIQSVATEVPVCRLSTHIRGRVDLLKLDVEGAEGDVIDELAQSGALGQVSVICVEYHHDIIGVGYPLVRMRAVLDGQGFRLDSVSTAPNGKTSIIHAFRTGGAAV